MDEKEAKNQAKDAIIFIPGLGRQFIDQGVETITRKLTGALDRQALRPEPTFRMIGMPDEEYGNKFKAKVRAIGMSRPGKQSASAIADVYELDYKTTLTGRFEARNPFSKVLVMVSVLIPVAWRSLWAVRQKGKELRDKLQMLTMAFIMLAVAAFTVMMVIAGAQTLKEVGTHGPLQLLKASVKAAGFGSETEAKRVTPWPENGSGSGSSGPAEKKPAADRKEAPPAEAAGNAGGAGPQLGVFQALIVLLAAMGLFNKNTLKESISVVATEYVCASNYLRMANQKQLILGQFMALLEHIAEKSDQYRHIHVVAYSFGSLLAIDALFPNTRPGPRLAMVKRLVTIGCPLDLVRTYYPNYFTQRQRIAGSPDRWINLYAPLDVFGSNFRNDSRRREADQGVTLLGREITAIGPERNIAYDAGLQIDQLNWFDVLTVKGMKLHGGYWTAEETPELNCFDSIVMELFEYDPETPDAAADRA